MATSRKTKNILNSFYFSECSIRSFKENILVKREFECVFNKASNEDDYSALTSFIPGQLYNVDEQCKRSYGENSRTLYVK